jgi:hypothetical protein
MINRVRGAVAVAKGRWQWRKARSLADLANLRADQIARNLPGVGRRPRTAYLNGDGTVRLGPPATAVEQSTKTMYSALVALGRTGVVVHDWHPGTFTEATGEHPAMATRACVAGFADDETKDWLDSLLYYAGKEPGATGYELGSVLDLWAPGQEDYERWDGVDAHRSRGHWVERIDDTPTVRIGDQMTAREVYRAFPTRGRVQRELRKAWLITIVAPTWGDNTMFADLLPLLAGARRPAEV